MAKRNKKIKLYIDSRFSIQLRWKGERFKAGRRGLKSILLMLPDALFDFFYNIGLLVITALRWIGKALYNACYYIGNAYLRSIARIALALTNDFNRTRKFLRLRLRKLLEPELAKALAICLLVLLAGSASFASLKLTAKGLELKNKILKIANIGSRNLQAAKDALSAQDWAGAENRFLLAYQSFNESKRQMRSTGMLLNQLLNVVPQKQSADRLLEAVTLLSQSGSRLVELYKGFQQVHVTAEGLSTETPFPELLAEMDRQINAVNANLDRANKLLDGVDVNHLPEQYREQVLMAKGGVSALTDSFGSLKDVYDIVSEILLGQKNVLVLFENNNELRPGGGFIGVTGNFRIDNGRIDNFHIGSVYDLDGQLTEKIVPPNPILNVNDRWFLRDSNWFASFPESAKKTSVFYEKEGGETPDMVVALTPSVISDILKITGPITLSKYGATFDSENFVEKMQAISTIDRPNDSPKQALADFFPVLMQKIGELEPQGWAALIEALQQNLNGKQLVFYSRDNELQSRLSAMRWTGEVADTDKDYLQVITANLGGTKTDLYIQQEVSLKIAINEKGEIIDELTITRKNNLPKMENTGNLSFIRVLVPEGSQFISSSGFDYKTLDPLDAKDYRLDPQVTELEKGSVRDLSSGTMIGKEAGKTTFGNWLDVKGGESKTVTLTYKLPFKQKNTGSYSLLIQKQPGSLPQSFNLSIDFPSRAAVWNNFDTVDLREAGLATQLILDKDRFLGVILDKH